MTPELRLFSTSVRAQFATRMRRVIALSILGFVVAAVGTLGVWAAFQTAAPVQPELAAMLPQGALLTIQARDFSGLLKRWNDSPEKSSWLKSDSYSVFSRSRLFGRLGDAQTEFAQSAGLPPDMSFLQEVAGSESVFAWYDIGKLEFLYITRMPSGNADKTRLLQMRSKFSTRQIENQTFYVRTQAGQAPGSDDQAHDSAGNSADKNAQASPQGQARTVAFAISGDWLLLATREDLMARALTLIAASGTRAANGNLQVQDSLADSVSREPWFVDAHAAAMKEPGELRMTLNLEKIVPTPYFRSYWIQRNITEMKQYRSAVADLYMQPDRFREERVLLPKAPGDHEASSADLGSLVALLPERAGVYRAIAEPSTDTVIRSLNEKLLQHAAGSYNDTREAPVADVSVHDVGSATDFETRIDDAPLAHSVKGDELAGLRQALAASDLQAMMTVSRSNEAQGGVWVPFQSAIVLSSAKDWNVPAMQAALQQALRAQLTASGLGLAWKAVKTRNASYFEISDTQRLEMAIQGKLCILSDDPGLMQEMLGQRSNSARATAGKSAGKTETAKPDSSSPTATTLVAGFNPAQEQASFARWSGLVDRTNNAMNRQSVGADGDGGTPSFFSQNMRGLGETFAALENEQMVERRDAAFTRQTVTYTWRH